MKNVDIRIPQTVWKLLTIGLTSYVGAIIFLSATAVLIASDGSSCWYSVHGEFGERSACLEVGSKGTLRVKRSHLKKIDFDGRFATLRDEKHGWMYVNKKGDVLATGVMAMDNGPDYVQEGFVRYEKSGKCGYENLLGQNSIKEQFGGCMPFENGIAQVCNGCRLQSDGEHQQYKGGEFFCIDTKAQRIACAP